MAYLSLYRKYRSQSFEEVSGQDHVTRTLQNAVRSGRVAHAYLLCGPRGTGKTTTARLLAKAVNCERGPTPEPCNECDACVQITEGRFLDINEIDAASNRSIDDMRDLRDNVAFTPAQGRYKVYIIDEAHQLTPEAFNALLKTLEEPPPHVIFVLATTESHKIPATISSRCQKFDFRRASLEQLRSRVAYVAREEGAEIEPAALELIARDANGGWRDALSLLEQVLAFTEGKITAKDVYTVLGTVEADTLHRLAEQVLAGRGGEVMGLLDELICEGKDPRQLLRDLTSHYRSLLLAAVGVAPDGEPDQAGRTAKQARAYGHLRLMAAIEVLAQTEREARWSEQPRLLLELAAVRLIHPRQPASVQAAPPARSSTTQPRPAPAPSRAPSVPPQQVAAPRDEPPPLVDEPPPDPEPSLRSRNGSGASGSGFGTEPLAPPPLTVGDARTGARDNEGDDGGFEDAFGLPPAQPAAQAPPGGRTSQAEPAPSVPSPAAASSPESAPAAELPAPQGSVDLGLLRGKWRLIGEELKRDKKIHIQTCLVDSLPDRVERDVLVIRFTTRTMAEMFTQRGKGFSEPLSAAIERVTGARVRVRAEFSDGAGPAAPAGGQPAVAAKPPAGPATGTAVAAARPIEAQGNGQAASGAPASLLTDSVSEPGPPPAAPRPGRGGSELVHDVLEVFDGRIVEAHDLES